MHSRVVPFRERAYDKAMCSRDCFVCVLAGEVFTDTYVLTANMVDDESRDTASPLVAHRSSVKMKSGSGLCAFNFCRRSLDLMYRSIFFASTPHRRSQTNPCKTDWGFAFGHPKTNCSWQLSLHHSGELVTA